MYSLLGYGFDVEEGDFDAQKTEILVNDSETTQFQRDLSYFADSLDVLAV